MTLVQLQSSSTGCDDGPPVRVVIEQEGGHSYVEAALEHRPSDLAAAFELARRCGFEPEDPDEEEAEILSDGQTLRITLVGLIPENA